MQKTKNKKTGKKVCVQFLHFVKVCEGEGDVIGFHELHSNGVVSSVSPARSGQFHTLLAELFLDQTLKGKVFHGNVLSDCLLSSLSVNWLSCSHFQASLDTNFFFFYIFKSIPTPIIVSLLTYPYHQARTLRQRQSASRQKKSFSAKL